MQGTGPYSVFVDANVWYARTLRDWIGMLYVTHDSSPFVVHWTEDVMAELIHGLRKQHPEWSGAKIGQVRELICGTFEAGRVGDFEIDGSYAGPDPHDAHVHAAAVACRADVLVTVNVDDFTWDENASPYELMHPDDFLLLVDDAAPDLVAKVTAPGCATTGSPDAARRTCASDSARPVAPASPSGPRPSPPADVRSGSTGFLEVTTGALMLV